eukprot:TRINITY_DN4991_c0_g1_i8.p1 TRINITY_DN4991_c0_g1~~TRINITY_DN4991_c0_g1_i8.p1  ORF type:complete len:218 (-),score=54.64 TRINITY_DN4991_c0_g1_i8:91-744(-)
MYAAHRRLQRLQEGCPRELLRLGADADQQDRHGRTALMIACKAGNAATAELLLEHGAAADARDNGGRTAAHWLCGSVFPTAPECACILRLLLRGQGHADPDARTNQQETPMHVAMVLHFGFCGHPAVFLSRQYTIVRALLEAGANPEARDKLGRSTADLAAQRGGESVVRLLCAERAFQAFVCCTHPRLGVSSFASVIPKHLCDEVRCLLWDYAEKQ